MANRNRKAYRVTNWAKYNEMLVNRGSVTLWFDEDAIENWQHENTRVKRGRPFTFSDTAIECLLTLREVFHLPYRQTEGLAKSLLQLMKQDLRVPDYSSLAKRASHCPIDLQASQRRGPIDIVMDSTGLKVFGEGEWKVRTHGVGKRRTWRKLHLAINPATQEIEAEWLTENSGHDADQVEPLLERSPRRVNKFYGDGSYDKWKVYEALRKRGIEPIIPPQHNAKIKQHGNVAAERLPRDEAIRDIRRLGRSKWKQEIGYHRRSLSETAMYRLKTITGDSLKNRRLANQQAEARIRCKILNRLTQHGMPDSEWN